MLQGGVAGSLVSTLGLYHHAKLTGIIIIIMVYRTLQWAYGVTCWEIFSGGKVPYGGVDVTDLSQLLANGYRLDKPNNDACSDQL